MCRGTFVVATTVGVVEALKDQGYCKMNNTMMKSVAQQAKSHLGSATRAKKLASPSPSSSSATSNNEKRTKLKDEKAKQSEESLRTVMYLSCWGPN
ncbi:hypothetical protein JHK87_037665 [Glycine soja]|nr:hypothetical protein JHK87_037665 [Glycine soja]